MEIASVPALNDTLFSTAKGIANFGETFIDPFIPENPHGAPLTFESYAFAGNQIINPLLVTSIFGLILPLYTTVYLAPELLFDDPGQGSDLPWKPFEYANVLMDNIEPIVDFAVQKVWSSTY